VELEPRVGSEFVSLPCNFQIVDCLQCLTCGLDSSGDVGSDSDAEVIEVSYLG
jgi:hypothetical protein